MAYSTALDNQLIDEVLGYVRECVIESRNSGKLRTFIGLHGHVTLLHDRLQRWFDEKDKDRQLEELSGLAIDAVVALAMAFPRIPVDIKKASEEADAQRAERSRILSELAEERQTRVPPGMDGLDAG